MFAFIAIKEREKNNEDVVFSLTKHIVTDYNPGLLSG